MQPGPSELTWTSDDERKLEYFRTHIQPHLSEALRFRTIGVQTFVAAQAFLFGAWAASRHPAVAVFGIASSVAFYLWDERSRFMMLLVHELGRTFADDKMFCGDDRKRLGIHYVLDSTLRASGKFRQLRSFTVGIRVLVLGAVSAWIWIGWQSLHYWLSHRPS